MLDILILLGNFIGLVILNYVIISFLEHFIHRYLMHQRSFPKTWYVLGPYLHEVFCAHAIRHHRKWYKTFNFEPNPLGQKENLCILPIDTAAIILLTIPLWIVWMLISPLGGFMYVLMVIIHNQIWNRIHTQMHIPSDVFFKDWALYKYLARYHFLHHQYMGRNFNVVFPLADFCVGRMAQPNFRDVRNMLKLNLLSAKNNKVALLPMGSRERKMEAFPL